MLILQHIFKPNNQKRCSSSQTASACFYSEYFNLGNTEPKSLTVYASTIIRLCWNILTRVILAFSPFVFVDRSVRCLLFMVPYLYHHWIEGYCGTALKETQLQNKFPA